MGEVQTAMVVFGVAAVVINVLIYAGISWAYFSDKHRIDPPKQAGVSPHALPATRAEDRPRELHHAA